MLVKFTNNFRNLSSEILNSNIEQLHYNNLNNVRDCFLFRDASVNPAVDTIPEDANFVCKESETIYSGKIEDSSFEVPDAIATGYISNGVLEEVI